MLTLKTIIVIICALSLVAAAAWFGKRWLQLQAMAGPNNARATTMVVVAAKPIKLGKKIDMTQLKLSEWALDNLPDGVFQELDQVTGQVARQEIFVGEAIFKARVAEHTEGSTLSAIIPKYKRAVSIRVNDIIGVAGFILPGNRVDILSTRTSGSGTQTRTLLQNMKVLAVDQTTGGKDTPVLVRAVTLEVTPAESEILIEGQSKGPLQLALRNQLDNEVIASETPVAKRKKVKVRRYLTIIRGTDISESAGEIAP